MSESYVKVDVTDAIVADYQLLSNALDKAETSSDGRRIVILSEVDRELLVDVINRNVDLDPDKPYVKPELPRPYAVHAARKDGVRRTWLVRSRNEARTLAKNYRENDGSAVIQDLRS